jgi:hypothetical protein
LHQGFARLDRGSPNALFARSQLVRLGAIDVRILALVEALPVELLV